jgi:DNA-binding NarL/FixJ family response regulator
MPGLNGLQAMEKLKESCPQVRVLILTRHSDSGFLKQLLKAGALGYALKLSPSEDLMRAIHTVAAGNTYLDPAMADKFMRSLSRPANKPGPRPLVNLSEREEEVLRFIAGGHSNKEIAARLDLSVKTIEAHKANAVLRGWLETPET